MKPTKPSKPPRAEDYCYDLHYESGKGNSYAASVVEFPDISLNAPTREAAIYEIRLLVANRLTILAKAGAPIPKPFQKGGLVRTVEIDSEMLKQRLEKYWREKIREFLKKPYKQ